MKILGIDPGLQTIGFALWEQKKIISSGRITTDSGSPLGDRLLQISEDISELLEAEKPQLCAIEKLFFVQNVTNGIAVSHARGILLCEIARRGIPFLEVSPKDVKLAVCGYGNAPKDQVQRSVQNIFSLPKKPQDDTADAIAIAFWASQQKH